MSYYTCNYKLSGGAFISLVSLACKKAGTQLGRGDRISNPTVFKRWIQVFSPEFRVANADTDNFDTYTSRYKACLISNSSMLPFDDAAIRDSFDQRIHNDYGNVLSIVAEFTEEFIDRMTTAKKDLLLIARLVKLIDDDSSISQKQEFYVEDDGRALTKEQILEREDFYFESFLLGVWHFIITNRPDNTVGKSTVNELFPPSGTSNRGGAKRKYNQSFDLGIKTLTLNYSAPLIGSSIQNEDSRILGYLSKLRTKYDKIKTLLYSDQPRPFYDFYVCNRIERRMSYSGSSSGSAFIHRNTITIENVTPSKILSFSHFAILQGTGGIGKSMMMRHLLLSTIDHYQESKQIPVYILLKDFDGTDNDLKDYVFSKIISFGNVFSSTTYEQLLEKGRLLFLFDGFDEISSVLSPVFEKQLESFIDRYPENQCIVSSRPYQSFASFSRFAIATVLPFSKEESVKLIQKLDFRPDDPSIKKKFCEILESKLWCSHRAFIENPLLLTIMLMTFEQFAEVPSKMEVFYGEAFAVLAQKHDASKGAYKRVLRSGLSVNRFKDYFSEFCARTYYQQKVQLTSKEFADCFNQLHEKEKDGWRITPEDFIFDVCSSMCLMFFESGKYHFIHRSFQEYFCALFFSNQKDKTLESTGDFFEQLKTRSWGDHTFDMLYDMIPNKIEEYVFLPFLTKLFEKCDEGDGYWTFLETYYPRIQYTAGETDVDPENDPPSFLYSFIKAKHFENYHMDDNLPKDDWFLLNTYGPVWNDETEEYTIECIEDLPSGYAFEHGEPEVEGYLYQIDVADLLSKKRKGKELHDTDANILKYLDTTGFWGKREYEEAKDYYKNLQDKVTYGGSDFFDQFS